MLLTEPAMASTRARTARLAPLLLAPALALPASADVFYLKDGGQIEGSGVDEGATVLIKVPLGSISCVCNNRIARSNQMQ